MWLPAQFVPIFFLDLNAVVFRRLFDVGESLIAIGIRDPLDLVKAGQSILTCAASVSGSFPCRGKAYMLLGRSLRSVSSPCFVCGFHVVLLVIFLVLLFTKDLRERRCYARKVSIMPAAGFGITRLFTNSPT